MALIAALEFDVDYGAGAETARFEFGPLGSEGAALVDTITWAVWFDLTYCPLAWALGRVAGELWTR